MALSYLGDCQRIFPSDSRPLEQVLWKIVTTNPVSQHRLQAFRLYRSIADSEEAVQRLYTLWQERKAPKDCTLSESDYIGLSYMLAMHLPEKADKIIATQLSRIQNPDRKKEYQFISPSVSPRKAERDSVFASLLIAGNRRVEPWASSALANLNHRLREQESVAISVRPWKRCRKYSGLAISFSPPLGFAPCFPPIHRRKLGKKLMRFLPRIRTSP